MSEGRRTERIDEGPTEVQRKDGPNERTRGPSEWIKLGPTEAERKDGPMLNEGARDRATGL